MSPRSIQPGLDIKSEEKQRAELKAAKEKRRNYIIAGVCVVVSALILFFSSNLFYRSVSVVKVGNEGYSAPEYEYFYMDMYSNYYNMYYQYYGEYAQYFMPDEETLKQDTLENMQQVMILYDEAQEVGFEAPEEMQDLIEESVDTMKEAVSESGYTSLNSYLAAYFGKGMNEKLYRSLLEKSYITSYYYEELPARMESKISSLPSLSFFRILVRMPCFFRNCAVMVVASILKPIS